MNDEEEEENLGSDDVLSVAGVNPLVDTIENEDPEHVARLIRERYLAQRETEVVAPNEPPSVQNGLFALPVKVRDS